MELTLPGPEIGLILGRFRRSLILLKFAVFCGAWEKRKTTGGKGILNFEFQDWITGLNFRIVDNRGLVTGVSALHPSMQPPHRPHAHGTESQSDVPKPRGHGEQHWAHWGRKSAFLNRIKVYAESERGVRFAQQCLMGETLSGVGEKRLSLLAPGASSRMRSISTGSCLANKMPSLALGPSIRRCKTPGVMRMHTDAHDDTR